MIHGPKIQFSFFLAFGLVVAMNVPMQFAGATEVALECREAGGGGMKKHVYFDRLSGGATVMKVSTMSSIVEVDKVLFRVTSAEFTDPANVVFTAEDRAMGFTNGRQKAILAMSDRIPPGQPNAKLTLISANHQGHQISAQDHLLVCKYLN